MQAVKRLVRRLRRRLEPLLELDVFSRQHQILIALFIVGGVFVFVTLKGLLAMMFSRHVEVVEPTYELDSALKDYSKCWFPDTDKAINRTTGLSKSQYKHIQLSWKSDLKYISCRSYGSTGSNGAVGSIRHKQRLVYEYDVVKHLNSQWRNNDFVSYESRSCSVHASNTGSNLYYNYYVEPVVNASGNSSHHKHSLDGSVSSTLSATAAAASSIYNFFSGQSSLENTHIQVTPKNHNRLSDAGMCVMTSYSTQSTTSGSSREFSNAKDLIKCLPSFIIAGVMKSGTGELMKWLNTHPNLISGRGANNQNEIHYFNSDQLPQFPGNLLANSSSSGVSEGSRIATRGGVVSVNNATSDHQDHHHEHKRHHTVPKTQVNFLEYVNRFPSFHANQANLLYTFDKSPDYVRSPEVMFNIVNMLPSIKILLLLRNPTQRTISAFNHNCRHGRYVRLLRDVVVDGVTYRKGRILNTDSKFKSVAVTSGGTGVGGHHDSVRYNINIASLKVKKDYTVMKYPCKAVDMHEYFTGGLREVQTVSSSKNYTTTSGGLSTGARFTDADHHQAPEATHSFYDDQLNYVLKLVPKGQLKILFQEVLYSNTFRTLREVEGFLGIPCFDYAQVTLLTPSSTPSLRGSEDDTVSSGVNNSSKGSTKGEGARGGRPPERAPVTLDETVEHYTGIVKQFFQLKKKKPSTSYQLQREALPETLEHFRTLFKRHNQRLVTLLQHYQLHEEVAKLRDSNWDL